MDLVRSEEDKTGHILKVSKIREGYRIEARLSQLGSFFKDKEWS
jgi:hypothetical protein